MRRRRPATTSSSGCARPNRRNAIAQLAHQRALSPGHPPPRPHPSDRRPRRCLANVAAVLLVTPAQTTRAMAGTLAGILPSATRRWCSAPRASSRATNAFLCDVVRGHASRRAGGRSVGAEFRPRRGARIADRRDAGLPRRRNRAPQSRRPNSPARPSASITAPTCAASRSAAPPRTCWPSPAERLPGAASARAPRRP